MAKQSGYLKRRDAEMAAAFNAGATVAMQFATDTLQMTIHQKDGWGYARIMRLTHDWVATQREYKPSLNHKDPAADFYREHMDRVLKEIIQDKAELIPHAERYKDLKKVTYGGWK